MSRNYDTVVHINMSCVTNRHLSLNFLWTNLLLTRDIEVFTPLTKSCPGANDAKPWALPDKTGTLTTNHMVVDKIWIRRQTKAIKKNTGSEIVTGEPAALEGEMVRVMRVIHLYFG
ncbi:hypothetical protein PIB30_052163 [Stylosanthes scabra]|uniref:Uncharacterized protein n=1 Tax=Stylosanthes scabra TaxID=79078 RepID=A0ABU6QHK8_9FABA|nr:hypothetical protein [Stylosanthes scabra]